MGTQAVKADSGERRRPGEKGRPEHWPRHAPPRGCTARPPGCRASILEMRKDHEEQLQRLKLLKDREIDAVTSATSHTRYA